MVLMIMASDPCDAHRRQEMLLAGCPIHSVEAIVVGSGYTIEIQDTKRSKKKKAQLQIYIEPNRGYIFWSALW